MEPDDLAGSGAPFPGVSFRVSTSIGRLDRDRLGDVELIIGPERYSRGVIEPLGKV